MKNIHILPTDKPTWLHKSILTGVLRKSSCCIDDMKQAQGMNIYITSDEEIKDCYYLIANSIQHTSKAHPLIGNYKPKKIIMTTDQDLIKYGVQEIPDDFLEWFVKNPSCEFVNIVPFDGYNPIDGDYSGYELIIPKEEPKQKWDINTCRYWDMEIGCERETCICENTEPKQEPKQETLEEAAHKMLDDYGIKSIGQSIGVLEVKKLMVKMTKWQQERSYSEEEVFFFIREALYDTDMRYDRISVEEWFEKFKKK